MAKCDQCTGLACGDECDGKSHANTIDCSTCRGNGFVTIEDIRIDGYHGLPNKKCNVFGGSWKIQIQSVEMMTNEKDRESNPSEYAPVSKEYSNALIARDIWKSYNEADYETAYKIVSLVESEAVKSERDRCEDIVCAFWPNLDKIRSAILSPDQGTDEKEAKHV